MNTGRVILAPIFFFFVFYSKNPNPELSLITSSCHIPHEVALKLTGINVYGSGMARRGLPEDLFFPQERNGDRHVPSTVCVHLLVIG